MKKLFLLIIFLMIFTVGLSAQNGWLPETEWKIIRGEMVDVIFPAELENEGQRAAGLLDHTMEELSRTLNLEKIRRWKLILWYGNSSSNGYVTAGPRYSLWNSGIDSFTFSDGEWLSLMASHEGRHMAQYDRINQGFGGFLHLLFGDGATRYIGSLCIPSWLFEGDAVLEETLLTESGRGRSSDFTVGMKAHLLEGNPTYSRVVNGSRRTIYPNWYEYGYFLTSYIRKHHGPEAIEKIFSLSSAIPVPLLGHSIGIRAATGKWPEKLFKEMSAELKGIYEAQIENINETEAVLLLEPGSHEYFSLSNPEILGTGEIALVKTDLENRRRLFVLSAEGEVQRFFNYNHFNGTGIKAFSGGTGGEAGTEVLFSGFSRHPRWPGEEYRDIIAMDTLTGREERLTEGRRFLLPAPTPDGKKVAAVEFFKDGGQELVLFNREEWQESRRFQLPQGTSVSDLTWHSDGIRLLLVLRGEYGRSIVFFDPSSGEFESLTGFLGGRVEAPLLWEDYIIYSAEDEGMRNIYGLEIESGRRFRITSRIYGASSPAVSGDTLYFIDMAGIRGEALASMTLVPEKWTEISSMTLNVDGGIDSGVRVSDRNGNGEFRVDYFLPVFQEDPLLSGLDKPVLGPETVLNGYEVNPYSPVKHAVNIHSWGFDPESLLTQSPELKLGITSTDILGTTFLYGYGSWNINENTFGGGGSFILKSLYPVISLSGLVRGRDIGSEKWTEAGMSGDFSFPLDFSMGLKNRRLDLSLGGAYFSDFSESFTDGSGYLTGNIIWSSYLMGGYKRIYPLIGLSAGLFGTQNPVAEDYVYTGLAKISLPGLFKTHSTRIMAGGELLAGTRPSGLTFGRGYVAVPGNTTVSLILDYDFPILDYEIPLKILYIRRFWGNLFGQEFIRDGEHYPSAGGTLFIEFIPFNLENAVITLGVRGSYRFKDYKPQIEVVFMDGALID
ncbi:MAG: hypothetical protein JEY99_08875 [Spirochaetales bacterium]|nr:hypothetical protein [Spirochaetales bacterium]